LASEVERIQEENEAIGSKLKYHEEILEKKYENLEEKIYKRIEQGLKRIKKAIHYLNSFSVKEIEKTKEIQLDNLKKTIEILKGKYADPSNGNFEEEIEELMNPIRNIQEELHQKIKEINQLKMENGKLGEEVRKYKKIERELLPQYK
jgi:chromosome segregation ATPase